MKTVERACEIAVAICAFLCFASGVLIVVGGVYQAIDGPLSDLVEALVTGGLLIILGSVIMGFIACAVHEEVKDKDEKSEE